MEKFEALSTKSETMLSTENSKQYDLEGRTLKLAKQVVRSSGSVGANYIEANESLSKKDFVMRVKICRKEAKESNYWFELITTNSLELEEESLKLAQEAKELMMIFSSIMRKSV